MAVEQIKALKNPVTIEKKKKQKKRLTLKELQEMTSPTLKQQKLLFDMELDLLEKTLTKNIKKNQVYLKPQIYQE